MLILPVGSANDVCAQSGDWSPARPAHQQPPTYHQPSPRPWHLAHGVPDQSCKGRTQTRSGKGSRRRHRRRIDQRAVGGADVWQERNRALRRRISRKEEGKWLRTHARKAISEGGKGASERVQKGAIKADTGSAARAQIKEERFSRDVWEGVDTRKPAAVAYQDRYGP